MPNRFSRPTHTGAKILEIKSHWYSSTSAVLGLLWMELCYDFKKNFYNSLGITDLIQPNFYDLISYYWFSYLHLSLSLYFNAFSHLWGIEMAAESTLWLSYILAHIGLPAHVCSWCLYQTDPMIQGIKGKTINKRFTFTMIFKCQKTKQNNNHWKLLIRITDMNR